MSEVLISYKNVKIKQDEQTVLENVDLDLKRVSFVDLIGKVGGGKSILLKTMYAELDIVDGEAEVLGFNLRKMKQKHVPNLRRRLGIVFQDFQLLTDRSVHDNLEFVLRATGWHDRKELEERIRAVLKLVGMDENADKRPNELSGGEQQRVVIARAVLNSPDIILADEPTGNLDAETGRSITKLLHDLSDTGSLVVMTTHNLQLLREFPGEVYRCEDHKLVKE